MSKAEKESTRPFAFSSEGAERKALFVYLEAVVSSCGKQVGLGCARRRVEVTARGEGQV